MDNEGLHTHAEGRATITVTATDESGVSAHCKVAVYKTIYISSVTVDASSKVMYLGESVYLHATVCPVNATDKRIMWLSSDEDVATVNPTSGLVTAQGPGAATIFAMTLEGLGVSGSCTVTVQNVVPVRSVMVCPSSKCIRVGESDCLTATVYPRGATNKSIHWYSDNPDVAIVTRTTGVVMGKSDGTATITAMTVDGGFVSSCTVTVDSREVVTIEEDGKVAYGSKYFKVQFSNGMVWKNVSCNLSKNDVITNALEAEIRKNAEERYEYNSTKEFCVDQLAFIYLVNPLGVEHYVKNISHHRMDMRNRLLFEDNLYQKIFEIKPQYFTESFDGELEECSYAVNPENREKVYSEAEILFGSHSIYNLHTLANFAMDILKSLIPNLIFKSDKIPKEVSEIVDGVKLYQHMFYSASVNENIFSGASYFFQEYALLSYKNGASGMFSAINMLLSHIQCCKRKFYAT